MELQLQAEINALGCLDGNAYEKEPDCLETVKRLIRFLRNDNDASRVKRILVCSNVIASDLLPILTTYPNEDELFDATLRLITNLIQPATEKIAVKEDSQPKVLHDRLELLSGLKNTKFAFAELRFFEILVLKLKPILEQALLATEEDRLFVERTLMLVRNILQLPMPDEDVNDKTAKDVTAQEKIILQLRKSGFDSLLLEMAKSSSYREFHCYILSIITLMLRDLTPEELISDSTRTEAQKQADTGKLFIAQAREQAKTLEQIRRCSGRHTSFAGSYTVHGMKTMNDANDVVTFRPLLKPEDISFDARKKRRRPPKNRALVSETTADPSAINRSRKSAPEVRSIMKEFCETVINTCFSSFIRSVHFLVQRQACSKEQNDFTLHYWWLLRYIFAFIRLQDCKDWRKISDSITMQHFHDAQTQLEDCLDMMKMDKSNARLWGRKAHVVLKAYGELLFLVLALEGCDEDHDAVDIAMEIQKSIFYVMEYRELLISLMKKYNPAVFTKSYLKDLVEVIHVYIKMLGTHCLAHSDGLMVEVKRKKRRKNPKKHQDKANSAELTDEQKRQKLEDNWQSISAELAPFLEDYEVNDDPSVSVIPYDAAAEHGFDEKIVAQVRIRRALASKEFNDALNLLRASRELWPEESGIFGESQTSKPDDLLIYQQIFFQEYPEIPGENVEIKELTVETNDGQVKELFDGEISEKDEAENDDDDNERKLVSKEIQFSFDEFLHRFCHSDILRWYIWLLGSFDSNTPKFNYILIKMLHRIAFDLKMAPLLYQASLFRVLQKIANTPGVKEIPGSGEILRFSKHLLSGFFDRMKKDHRLVVEILFWKNFKEAYEIEYGYGSYKLSKKTRSKKVKNQKNDIEPIPMDENNDAVENNIEEIIDSS